MTTKQNNHRGQRQSSAHPKMRKASGRSEQKSSRASFAAFSPKGNYAGSVRPGQSTGYVGIDFNTPSHKQKKSSGNASGASARHASGGFFKDASGSFRMPNMQGPLLTRRNLIIGAVGLGVVAVGAGVALKTTEDEDTTVEVLEVADNQVVYHDSLSDISADVAVQQTGNFELTYGTMVLSNDDYVAICLLPTETSDPLTQVGLINLNTGTCSSVVEQAEGSAENFQIVDAVGNKNGIIWTESNVLKNEWRVYAAKLSEDYTLGKAYLLDNGGSDWETPSLTAAGSYGFWQTLPTTTGSQSTSPSVLHRTKFGSSDKTDVYSSPGRMACFPSAYDKHVIITPRISADNKNYQLTLIDAESGNVEDTLILPSGMAPLTVGYGKTGFIFSFDSIYNYGDGISNLGTYTPYEESKAGYSNEKWFCFNRTPDAPAAWCGLYFIVKSTTAVCGMDFKNNTIFSLDVAEGADDYGEYVSACPTNNTLVTYTNIDYEPIDGDAKKLCQVRVWAPVSDEA